MVNVALLLLAFLAALLALLRALGDHFSLQRRLGEMERRADEIARMLRQRGNLANELAHEIKNPITAILCSAEALDYMVGKDIGADHRKCLGYIKEYGENLLHLVGDFIDLTRAEGGHMQSTPEKTPVTPLLESIAGLLQCAANKKHINLTLEAIPPGLSAYADARHLKQVVFNLIHNAIKFTGQGGEVRVSAEADPENCSLIVRVRDNGRGIAPDRLEMIFDPYMGCSDRGQDAEAGLGLGLAVCKALLNLEGGSIEVSSELGTGSCFIVRVPLWQADSSAEEKEGQWSVRNNMTGDKPLCGRSFLLIDHDQGACQAIAELIKVWGGTVDQVAMAIEALQAISANSYDAIMIDKTADGLNSWELAKLIREDACSQTTLVAAVASEKEGELALKCGADRLMHKPVGGAGLLKCLEFGKPRADESTQPAKR